MRSNAATCVHPSWRVATLLEINVFSPGGLNSAQSLQEVTFCGAVVDSLEQKVAGQRAYGRLANVQLATLSEEVRAG